MADITLAWMMDQMTGNTRNTAKPFEPLDWIKFDNAFINTCFMQTSNFYRTATHGNEYKGWGMGKVYDSNTFPQSLTGAKVRTPGKYQKSDYHTGKFTGVPLENTCEYIHSSTRARIDLAGRPVEPKKWTQGVVGFIWRLITFQKKRTSYHPQRAPKGAGYISQGGPLHGWKLIDGHESHGQPNMQIDMSPGGINQVHWEYTGPDRTSAKTIKEDIFAEKGYEERLLLHDQEIANKIIFSNNKWQWFKTPQQEHRLSKTF